MEKEKLLVDINGNLLINNFIEYEQKLNRSDKTLKLYKTEINLFIKRYNFWQGR